jgi:hypothetical protein
MGHLGLSLDPLVKVKFPTSGKSCQKWGTLGFRVLLLSYEFWGIKKAALAAALISTL